jgi:hypothetical protein
MKVFCSFAAASILAVAVLTSASSQAQQPIAQTLSVTKVESVREPAPAIIEVVVALEDGSKATLRMNAFTMSVLRVQLNAIGQ